jgi:hypothetical protein
MQAGESLVAGASEVNKGTKSRGCGSRPSIGDMYGPRYPPYSPTPLRCVDVPAAVFSDQIVFLIFSI